ncbi:GDSL-type esterase/lipase family protein [Spirosoma sp. SC4-14]|uniref:GDSL-type esterase/lipase family protein n=1 Tax=Spirosoma sp. SC4-14 TaxID=3128900 RepID=UPI0030CBF438
MNVRRIGYLTILIFVLLSGCGADTLFPQSKRIACIGTSITEGYSLPVEQTYPYQLQTLIGSPDKVLNYGVGGTTVLKSGDSPYWNAQKYQYALDWKPTIVIIEFGTNDSKQQNWQHKSDFKADYLAMIRSFQNLSSSPRVYVCIPPPAFSQNFDVDPDVVKNEIVPLVNEIANETNVTIIDLYTLMLPHSTQFIDGIHPTAEGAATIAKEVYKVITTE